MKSLVTENIDRKIEIKQWTVGLESRWDVFVGLDKQDMRRQAF